MSTTATKIKDYETVDAGEIVVGDYLREKLWNKDTKTTERAFVRVIDIQDGATSRWITLEKPNHLYSRFGEGNYRIRPRRSTKVQRRVDADLRPWAVGIHATAAKLAEFDTQNEAEDYLAMLPDVETGQYYLEPMGEDPTDIDARHNAEADSLFERAGDR